MINPFSKQCNTEYFDISDTNLKHELSICLHNRLAGIEGKSVTPVFLCIGTDRATGDCLGPLVGMKLRDYNICYDIYGTLDAPVHALNLKDTIEYIQRNYDNPFIIAIDAALGNPAHVGFITVSDCPMEPGKGVNKKLPIIGDISITGIVNVSGRHDSILQTTRLYTVMQLANSIAEALRDCLNNKLCEVHQSQHTYI